MKAEIKIPKGYRRLRRNEHPRLGAGTDYWFDRTDLTWNEYGIYDAPESSDMPIRKIQKGGKKFTTKEIQP